MALGLEQKAIGTIMQCSSLCHSKPWSGSDAPAPEIMQVCEEYLDNDRKIKKEYAGRLIEVYVDGKKRDAWAVSREKSSLLECWVKDCED